MATDRVLKTEDSISKLVVEAGVSRKDLLYAQSIADRCAEADPHAYANVFPQLVDTHTGLIQRERLESEYLPDEMQRSLENKTTLFYGLMDIDDFKRINTHFGYELGHEVIRAVGKILRTEEKENGHIEEKRSNEGDVQPNITAARVGGGEEFGLIFYGFDQVDTYGVMERIRKTIQNTIVESLEGPVSVTVSGGFVKYEGESPEDLMKKAGKALTLAKQGGKNQTNCITSHPQIL